MRRNSKKTAALVLSLLFAATISITAFTEPVSAADVDGAKAHKEQQMVRSKSSGTGNRSLGQGVHADPTTFEKNFCLSVDQKEYAISEIDRVVSRIIKPGMSDLEKYYTLAVWEYKHAKYDSDFWSGAYNFDYYSHQWDAYGVLKEKSVCAGMAIFYANLCHAADLPCKFVRTDPELLDHTINYVPDINGNAYFVDVTENVFLNSENATYSFGPLVDKAFANITKDCTDESFEYYETDSYGQENLCSPLIKQDCVNKPFSEWYTEFALHQNTDKDFRTKYIEKGSGDGTTHASYQDFEKYPAQTYVDRPSDVTGIWFLDDFYQDPESIRAKVLNNELDEQLLNVSGIKDSYDCRNADELAIEVENDILVRYFPSCEDGEVVAWQDDLKTNLDYTVSYDSYDDEKGEAIFTIEGEGKYQGTAQVRVKWAPKYEIEKARILPSVYYSSFSGEYEPEVVYQGEILEEGKDYTWEKVNADETFDKVGDYQVRLIGKGDFRGEAVKTFHIIMEEGEAEQAVEEAKAELANAQAAIAGLDENSSPEEISAALNMLVAAQQSLTEAQEALARTKDILSEEKEIELEEQIEKLQQQLDELSTGLEQQIEDLKDELAEARIIDISMYPYTISLPKASYQYTGKAIEPEVNVTGLSPDYYTVSYSDNTKIGTATVTVTATDDPYKGSIQTTFIITKRTNTLAVKAKTAAVKYKTLKKKELSLNVDKVIKVKNKGQGDRTYAKVSGNKKITINKKTGKVTVKKGLKRGTYKVKVKVKAAGNDTYKASAWKNVTFKIKVK